MKNLICAMTCAAALMASPAVAGSLSDPVIEPAIVADDATENAGDVSDLIIPLMVMFIIVGAAGA